MVVSDDEDMPLAPLPAGYAATPPKVKQEQAQAAKSKGKAAAGPQKHTRRAPDPGESPVVPVLESIQALLLKAAGSLDLPPNPLDELISDLGGAECVAELTGRKQVRRTTCCRAIPTCLAHRRPALTCARRTRARVR